LGLKIKRRKGVIEKGESLENINKKEKGVMEKGGIVRKIEKEVLFPFHSRQGEKTNL
jgi:hypothetical protein